MHVQPDRSFHKTFRQWNYCNLIFNLIFQKKKKRLKDLFKKKFQFQKILSDGILSFICDLHWTPALEVLRA